MTSRDFTSEQVMAVFEGAKQILSWRDTLHQKIRSLTMPARFSGRCDPFSEDALSMQVAAALHEWTVTGLLHATWTKIPHEVGAVSRRSAEFGRANARYAKQKAMGLVAGSGDFVFVWRGGGGWIELKRKGGSLSPSQADFQDWCEWVACHYAVCRSVEDVSRALVRWGVLQQEKGNVGSQSLDEKD